MEAFDVIVIGAGPAGSTAAHRLAASGARVALLDRATFPRDKPCGGGVTLRGLDHIPVDIEPVVEDRISVTELGFGDGATVVKTAASPLVYMTRRRRLDEFLASAAVEAGADLREATRVRGIDLDARGATVATEHGALRASVVVGADGCNGVSATALELGGRIEYGVAYEGNVGWDVLDHDRWRGRLLLEFATVPGGYAWIFPKGDHANLGVGGWTREGPRMREHLAALCRRAGVPGDAVTDARGYRLPLRHPRSPVARGRAVVVGDAAGLVDPMSGDGMFEAFLSSRIAAECIGNFLSGAATGLDGYQRRLNGALATHRSISWLGKRLFDEHPTVARRLAGSDALWRRVESRIRGDRPARLTRPGVGRFEALARTVAMRGQG